MIRRKEREEDVRDRVGKEGRGEDEKNTKNAF